nr:auxin response factor 4 [Tanacetum cinerariifolium]
MKFCLDESPERRFIGVVTGVGDMDPYEWPNSKQRFLMKVNSLNGEVEFVAIPTAYKAVAILQKVNSLNGEVEFVAIPTAYKAVAVLQYLNFVERWELLHNCTHGA